MGISNVIALFCGIALFLFGMQLMGNGLKKVAGNKLELVLYKLTSTPLKGILLGTGITAVIQSSSATSIMVVGFVNSGMMKVKQAIGIVLGAILGTSITGWIICLSELGGDGASTLISLISTASITGIVAIIGIVFKMFCKKKILKDVGDIMMGFAVLMTGMSSMSSSVSVLRESQAFIDIMTSFTNPIIAILAATFITCILQSASATVGILQALSMTGAITFEVAFPIIMGIAIGAALPVITSALGNGINAKRTAFVYLAADVLGAVICSVVFYSLNAIVGRFEIMNQTLDMIDIALLNTVFRLVTVIILAPFIGLLEKFVCFVFKDKAEDLEETTEIDRLEEKFIQFPSVAVEQSMIAVKAMARKARKNLSRAFNCVYAYTDEKFEKIQNKEEVIDKFEDKLGSYLVKINSVDLPGHLSEQISVILHTITDYERIGDHAVNFSLIAKEMHEKNVVFSDQALRELDMLTSAVSEIVIITTDSFINDDYETAKKVEPLEQVVDIICEEIKRRHIERVRQGLCTLDNGFVMNDMLSNFERIADHCSNIAVAMLEIKEGITNAHEYLNKVKSQQSEEFMNTFTEYTKKYLI